MDKLLARHGIQCKTGGHFSHTTCAIGNYRKLDDHQHQEDDHADHIIAANHQVTEDGDNISGITIRSKSDGWWKYSIPSRKSVIISKTDGNTEKSIGRVIYKTEQHHTQRKRQVDDNQNIHNPAWEWDDHHAD